MTRRRRRRQGLGCALHLASGQLVELKKVGEREVWIVHPKTGQTVKSPKVLYDLSIRSEADLLKRQADLRAQQRLRNAAVAPFRLVDPVDGSVLVFKVNRDVKLRIQDGTLSPVWTPKGYALVTAAQRDALVDGWIYASPERLARLGARIASLVAKIQWVERWPHRRYRGTGVAWLQSTNRQLVARHGVNPDAARRGIRVRVNWLRDGQAGVTYLDSYGAQAVVPASVLVATPRRYHRTASVTPSPRKEAPHRPARRPRQR